MVAIDIASSIIFISQTGVGSLGNSIVLALYIFTFFTGHRLKPLDLLITHLAFVNNVVLLSKGIPQTIAAFGFKNFLNDNSCKLIFYFHRVARSLSLCTTCLLSGFQTIIINSKSIRMANFRSRMPKLSILFCFLCWALSLLINSNILVHIKGPTESRNVTERWELIYCSSFNISSHIPIFSIMASVLDLVCMGIMVWTSGSTVLILYRHHQQTQYILCKHFTPGCAPETRATQIILLLVSMFVSFYMFNSIMVWYIRFFKPSLWFVHTSVFLSACFPACSPYVWIMGNSQILRDCVASWQRIKLLS
ncbi:vomeronasal type-1 receptor 1-like [Gracilinanus agilis]|uniref:vomeronasal type-1 receptor 1-like n=1 Tax=Gracilinanus agilis TaxID=191870 RepID=UPI001CFEC9CB|nr:vomeronasal type-1 receptor 1-like [Gracilinanus agilis]